MLLRNFRLFFAAALLLVTTVALAVGTTANVSWTPPTAYIDGTALPASDIKNYTISWTHVGSTTVVGSVVVNAPASSAVIPGLTCGGSAFTLVVTTSATAAYPNASSDPNTPVPYATGVTCRPNGVSGITVS